MKNKTISLSIAVLAIVLLLAGGACWMLQPQPARVAVKTDPDPSHPAMMGGFREKGAGQAGNQRL